MRIYNGTKSLLDLPITGRVRLTVLPNSVSKEFMPSEDFINLIVQVYQSHEIALIISGPYELNMCAKNPAVTPLLVHSLDEAVIRFNGPAEKEEEESEVKEEPMTPEPEPEPVLTEEVTEETVEEQPVVNEDKPKKKRSKKH